MNPYKPSLPFVVSQLTKLVPEYEGMLEFIEKTGEWIRLPNKLNQVIERLKVDNYPELYRDEQALAKMTILAVIPAERINELGKELKGLPEDQKPSAMELLVKEMEEVSDAVVDSFPVTDQEKQAAQKQYDEMSPEEQAKTIQQAKTSLSGFLAAFFNTMSMMVHGRSLINLVKAAEAGDDDAFCLAIHIDKRILTTLPYFKGRHAKALNNGHSDFLDKLHYRQNSPLLRGKIRYRTLWLTFAYLDQCGYLDGSLKHHEILDICDRAGVGGFKNRIDDVGYLSKRLREYRKFQETNQKSRH